MNAYEFFLRGFVPHPNGKHGWYKVLTRVVVARNVEEAEAQVKEPWWCWVDLGPRCAACKGVYHEATGHYISETMVWCGPCTREFVKFLKQQTSRRWGGVRFYDVAVPPPDRSLTPGSES